MDDKRVPMGWVPQEDIEEYYIGDMYE